MNKRPFLFLRLSPYWDNVMQKFEIPLYIWLNATVLIAAGAFISGRILGEAAEHKRHARLRGNLGHV